jgi:hypothetical protein
MDFQIYLPKIIPYITQLTWYDYLVILKNVCYVYEAIKLILKVLRTCRAYFLKRQRQSTDGFSRKQPGQISFALRHQGAVIRVISVYSIHQTERNVYDQALPSCRNRKRHPSFPDRGARARVLGIARLQRTCRLVKCAKGGPAPFAPKHQDLFAALARKRTAFMVCANAKCTAC